MDARAVDMDEGHVRHFDQLALEAQFLHALAISDAKLCHFVALVHEFVHVRPDGKHCENMIPSLRNRRHPMAPGRSLPALVPLAIRGAAPESAANMSRP